MPDDSYTVTWGPLEIPPGVEEVRCVTARLGNDIPVNINRIHNVLGDVSHHLIVYKAPAGTPVQSEPYPCDSIENLISEENGYALMITQKAEEMLQLPPGVGFLMEAEQIVRLELHYVNASDAPKNVQVTSIFTPIPDAELEHHADLLFVGDPDINIPPMSSHTLGPVYTPMPYELADSKIFGITGHEHQWGTNVIVELGASETGPFEMVYNLPNFVWSEPETVYFDEPLTLQQGGGFRFQCDWTNMSNRRVGFGEGVNDEMCFFWAYYYPSKGAKVCVHTDQAGGQDICCPGSPLCSFLF